MRLENGKHAFRKSQKNNNTIAANLKITLGIDKNATRFLYTLSIDAKFVEKIKKCRFSKIYIDLNRTKNV